MLVRSWWLKPVTWCSAAVANAASSKSILSSHCRELALPREIREQNHSLEMLQHRKTLTSEPYRYLKEMLLRHARSAAHSAASQ